MALNLLVAVAVGFGLTQIANVATTVYLHRTLAHRALTLSPALTAVFRGIIWLLTGIRRHESPILATPRRVDA